jgi:predicted CoA-binding protein
MGNLVLQWYHQHSLPVTPLNPKGPVIDVHGTSYQAVKSPTELEDPENTALSVVCAPPITKNLLKEAKQVGIKAVWLQPGTFDDEILKYAQEEFEAGVGGTDGGTVGGEGWCVLVDGEQALDRAGRRWESRL